jgi:hypothetical protein
LRSQGVDELWRVPEFNDSDSLPKSDLTPVAEISDNITIVSNSRGSDFLTKSSSSREVYLPVELTSDEKFLVDYFQSRLIVLNFDYPVLIDLKRLNI